MYVCMLFNSSLYLWVGCVRLCHIRVMQALGTTEHVLWLVHWYCALNMLLAPLSHIIFGLIWEWPVSLAIQCRSLCAVSMSCAGVICHDRLWHQGPINVRPDHTGHECQASAFIWVTEHHVCTEAQALCCLSANSQWCAHMTYMSVLLACVIDQIGVWLVLQSLSRDPLFRFMPYEIKGTSHTYAGSSNKMMLYLHVIPLRHASRDSTKAGLDLLGHSSHSHANHNTFT